VRDNSKHTVCDQCVTAEHEKKVASRPPMQNEIQELEKKSMGNCGACSKQIFTESVTFQNVLFHPECWACQKCKRQMKKGDGCAREGKGFLCESCC
jgi:hypothetical protein